MFNIYLVLLAVLISFF